MKLLYSFDCVDCEQVFISPHANRLLIRDKGILEYRLLEYEATTGQYINRHQLKPGAFIETCIWNETGDAFFVKSAAGQIVFILSGEKITAFSNAEYDWIDAIDGSFSNRSLFLIRNTEATTGYDPILRRNIKCDQTLIYRMPLP